MSLNQRLSALKAKQKTLTTRIQTEWCRPKPDLAFLRILKIRRMRIQEEIAALVQRA